MSSVSEKSDEKYGSNNSRTGEAKEKDDVIEFKYDDDDTNELALEEVPNKRYDAKVEIDRSFSDESIETNEVLSPKNSLDLKKPLKIGSIDEVSIKNSFDKKTDLEEYSDELKSFSRNSTIPQITKKSLDSPTERTEYSKQYHLEEIDELTKDLPSDVSQILDYQREYLPHDIEIPGSLKCFIPDYIPTIGQPPDFIMVDPPCKTKIKLGLTVLDEPALFQSDKNTLLLNLQASHNVSAKLKTEVPFIEQASQNSQQIDLWINNVKEIQKGQSGNIVNQTAGPNVAVIEQLMEAWPQEVEDALQKSNSLQTLFHPKMDLNLEQYARFLLVALGIRFNEYEPISSQLIDTLHCVFSAYREFSENTHFKGFNEKSVSSTP